MTQPNTTPIKDILFSWHQHRQSYWDDFEIGALTEAEWNKVRDNIDQEAEQAIQTYIDNKTEAAYQKGLKDGK